MKKTVVLSVSAVLLLGGLAALGYYGLPLLSPPPPTPTVTPTPEPLPCFRLSSTYMQSVDAIVAEWDDADQLAGATPRNMLGPQVATLQEIRRRVDSFPRPDCVETAHARLVVRTT